MIRIRFFRAGEINSENVSGSTVSGKKHLEHFQNSNEYKELFGIDGESFEFEWNVLQCKWAQSGISPEEFDDTIIFMSMYNDIDWTKKIPMNVCRTLYRSEITQKKISDGTLVSSRSRRGRKSYGTHNYKAEAHWKLYRRCHGIHFRRQRTSSFQRFQCVKCVGSRILEKED